MTEFEAKELIEKIVSASKADDIVVNLSENKSYNIRFAANNITTCGAINRLNISLRSIYGKRSGTINITSDDKETIESGLRTSEKLAMLAPENDEAMPPLDKEQNYLKVNEYFPETAHMFSDQRIELIRHIVEECEKKQLVAAGYVESSDSVSAIGNSKGLFAFHPSSEVDFSATVRTKDGTGSSKIHRRYADKNMLNSVKLSDEVIWKSELSANPTEIKPGKYTVILESAAACDMIGNLSWYMNKRSADEGRSYFSDKDKGNRIGEKIVSEKVNIYSDPGSELAPSNPFDSEGSPINKISWIENGVLKNMPTDRFWATKTNSNHIPYPSNIILQGNKGKHLRDLIESTEYGVLVTRLWYIRSVDPKQILLTGLTRDGVFLIENGKISRSLKNFRFNESPINVLNNILDMSENQKMVGSETGSSKIVVPDLKVKDFNFSSVSDAV